MQFFPDKEEIRERIVDSVMNMFDTALEEQAVLFMVLTYVLLIVVVGLLQNTISIVDKHLTIIIASMRTMFNGIRNKFKKEE